MAHAFPLNAPARSCLWPLWGLAAPALLVGSGQAGWCQVADVALPNGQGDFSSISVSGARGATPQQFWLVVDRDPRGLWCRDSRGQPLLSLRRGAVVETDPLGSSLLFRQDKPYLRLRVKPVDILLATRPPGERSLPPTCWVRANELFLAPIHPESLRSVLGR
ncbi:MAG: hypothetical protein ACK6AD_00820 [Cyanobacteriota bacterium]